MANIEIVQRAFRCERCSYVWIPRIDRRPVMCPSCRNRLWDKPREKVSTAESGADSTAPLN